MILANWAVLAILTSVVSDRMISSSQKLLIEEREKEERECLANRERQLTSFFLKIDRNRSGFINKTEWEDMLGRPSLKEELCEVSGLDEHTMRDAFNCLSEEEDDFGYILRYQDFVSYLNHDKDVADRRQVLHLSHLMKELEKITLTKLGKMEDRIRRKLQVLEGMLENSMYSVQSLASNVSMSDSSPRVSMLDNSRQSYASSRRSYASLTDPLDQSTLDRIEKLDKSILDRFEKLDDMAQRKFEVMEGMLEKVVHAVNQKDHHEHQSTPTETETSTLNRVEKLERMTQHNFEVLGGMLEKVMHAVNLNNQLEDVPIHNASKDALQL